MSKKRTPASGEREAADPTRAAAYEHLLDLIARLLARRWLSVQREAKKKRREKARPRNAR